MSDIDRELILADQATSAADKDFARIEAEEKLRDLKSKTKLANYGYTPDQYDYTGFLVDGGQLSHDPAVGVELPNRYIKPAQVFVAGRDISTGQKIVSPFMDKGQFIDRGVAQLSQSNKATGATPPPTDAQSLTSVAFGMMNDGVGSYADFSAHAPDWPEDQKRKAWGAAGAGMYRMDLENKAVNGQIKADDFSFPAWKKKVTVDELTAHPQWAEMSKQLYKGLWHQEWDGTDEAAGQYGLMWLSMFNWNVPFQVAMAARAKFGKDEKLNKMMYAMLTIDSNLEMSWSQTGKNLGAIAGDPTTYLSFGAGTIAHQAVKTQLKNVIGKELTKGMQMKIALRAGANVGAVMGAGFTGLDDLMRQTLAVESGSQKEYSAKQSALQTAGGAVGGAALGAVVGGVSSDPAIEFGRQLVRNAQEAWMMPHTFAGTPAAQRGAVGANINYPAVIPKEEDFAPMEVPFLVSRLGDFVNRADSGLPKKATPQQWVDKLMGMTAAGKEFKPEEMRWSGVLDWIDSQPKDKVLTLAEVQHHVNTEGTLSLYPDFRGNMEVEKRKAMSVYGKKEPALEGELIPAGESESKALAVDEEPATVDDYGDESPYSTRELEDAYSDATDEAFNSVLDGIRWSERNAEVDDYTVESEAEHYWDSLSDYFDEDMTDASKRHIEKMIDVLDKYEGYDVKSFDQFVEQVKSGKIDIDQAITDLEDHGDRHLSDTMAELRKEFDFYHDTGELFDKHSAAVRQEHEMQPDLVGYTDEDVATIANARVTKDTYRNLITNPEALRNYISLRAYQDDSKLSDIIEERARESASEMVGTITEDDLLGYEIHADNPSYGGNSLRVLKPNGTWMSEDFRNEEDAKQAIYMDMQDQGVDPSDHGENPYDYMDAAMVDWHRRVIGGMIEPSRRPQRDVRKREAEPTYTHMSLSSNGQENILLKISDQSLDKAMPGFTSRATPSSHHGDAANTMATARTATLSQEQTGEEGTTRLINEVQGDWAQYADKHISDVRGELAKEGWGTDYASIITSNPELMTRQPQTYFAKHERKLKYAAFQKQADGARANLESIKANPESKPTEIELAEETVDAYDAGELGWQWSQSKEIYDDAVNKYSFVTSGIEADAMHKFIDTVGVETVDRWAREHQIATYSSEELADHHLAYLIGKMRDEDAAMAMKSANSLKLRNAIDVLDESAGRITKRTEVKQKIDKEEWLDSNHAQNPMGEKFHEPMMNMVIADSIRKGETGLMWPADPFLISKVEGWGAPRGWAPDAEGDHQGKYWAGSDRTPQVRRLLKSMPEFVTKSLEKKYGVKLVKKKVSLSGLGGNNEMFYIRYTPQLIDAARRTGLNMTQAIAPIGMSAGLKQMLDMHKDNDGDNDTEGAGDNDKAGVIH